MLPRERIWIRRSMIVASLLVAIMMALMIGTIFQEDVRNQTPGSSGGGLVSTPSTGVSAP